MLVVGRCQDIANNKLHCIAHGFFIAHVNPTPLFAYHRNVALHKIEVRQKWLLKAGPSRERTAFNTIWLYYAFFKRGLIIFTF